MDDQVRQRLEKFEFPEAWDDPELHDLIRGLSMDEISEVHDYIAEVERFQIANKPATITELGFKKESPNLPSPEQERAILASMSPEEIDQMMREVKEVLIRQMGENVVKIDDFRNKERK